MVDTTRRSFLKQSLNVGGAMFAAELGALEALAGALPSGYRQSGSLMRFGLVTYLWGKDWDLPTLIRNCERAKAFGVELRTQHAHKVEADLSPQQRKEVKKRFDDSPVVFVGPGCNFAFHYPDKARVKQEIEGAKQYVKLSHDCGGSGLKVKPNGLPKGVPVEKTCEQIGKSLNVLGRYAADYGQEIRVEVHGSGTNDLPIMKKIFDWVTERNVGVCWNCNHQDLKGRGLEYNFNLVKNRLATTCHIHATNDNKYHYPYQQLMNLLVRMDYKGWMLIEAHGKPKDPAKALVEQSEIWTKMIVGTQKKLNLPPIKIK